MIARIFPDARVVLALRDPRDVCLSCYQQPAGATVAGRDSHPLGKGALHGALSHPCWQ